MITSLFNIVVEIEYQSARLFLVFIRGYDSIIDKDRALQVSDFFLGRG